MQLSPPTEAELESWATQQVYRIPIDPHTTSEIKKRKKKRTPFLLSCDDGVLKIVIYLSDGLLRRLLKEIFRRHRQLWLAVQKVNKQIVEY